MRAGLARSGPLRACLTHGFVTDEDGHKYSKSSKNFEPPEHMLNQYGAEILRMWVSAVDYRGDIKLTDEILKRVADGYRKVRNTFRFMLGSLVGFDPERAHGRARGARGAGQAGSWSRPPGSSSASSKPIEDYQFHTIYHALVQFATVELSNFYMNVTKDRMYCEPEDSAARRSGQTAYWLVLDALVRACAPILSFTAQEVWEFMPRRDDDPEFVFWAAFPHEAAGRTDLIDQARWDRLLELRDEVQRALEDKRGPRKNKRPDQIGSSQEAELTITASGPEYELLESFGADELTQLFIVSRVALQRASCPRTTTATCSWRSPRRTGPSAIAAGTTGSSRRARPRSARAASRSSSSCATRAEAPPTSPHAGPASRGGRLTGGLPGSLDFLWPSG